MASVDSAIASISDDTGRRAGIVFISLDGPDIYGIERARKLIGHYNLPIDILATLSAVPE